MSAPARFTKADVKRAVSGVEAAGIQVGTVEIDVNGKIRIIASSESKRTPKALSPSPTPSQEARHG